MPGRLRDRKPPKQPLQHQGLKAQPRCKAGIEKKPSREIARNIRGLSFCSRPGFCGCKYQHRKEDRSAMEITGVAAVKKAERGASAGRVGFERSVPSSREKKRECNQKR